MVTLGRLSPAELARWYSRASIYAFPARYEPFGLSVLEAAQASCALVLGDIPSLREIWGDAAVYAKPNDPGALRDALMELIADPQLRARRGSAARLAASQYSPETMTAGYVAAYEILFGRQQPVRSQPVCSQPAMQPWLPENAGNLQICE